MSAIDRAVEAMLASAKAMWSVPQEPSRYDVGDREEFRRLLDAAVAAGHLVPADDPDALLAALVNSGRLEFHGWGAPWEMEPHVKAHLKECQGCSASIHRRAFRLYRLRGSGS